MSGDKYLINDKQGCYLVTFTVIHWIDIFSREEYRVIMVDALNYCIAKKGLVVYAWVIMSNHVHLIITTKSQENISDIIRDFKKHTSKQIAAAIQTGNESRRQWLLNTMSKEAKRISRATHYKLWKDDNHAVYIDGMAIKIDERLNYTHENPLKNALVRKACDYVYSSTNDYHTNQKGLVNIDFAL